MKSFLRPALLLAPLILFGCGDPPLDPVDPDPVTPATPVELTTLGLGSVPERFTSEVAARGDWAYTGTWGTRGSESRPGNALKIWDVSGPVPALRDSIIVPNATTLGDVQISDDGTLLVVATERIPGSIIIYDRSDPARPRQLARFQTASTGAGVHTAKLGRIAGRQYAFLAGNRVGDPARSHLVVVDLTDPSQPREMAAIPMGNPFIHDVQMRDGILFAAVWHDGIRIFDVGGGNQGGSPENPVELGNVVTVDGAAHNVWWFHDPVAGSRRYAFVGEEQPGLVSGGSRGDIHVLDVSDLANPREVAFFNVQGAGTHNFWMDEASGVLYAAYYDAGVRALDVRGDLSTCTAEQRDARNRCDLGSMGREIGRGLRNEGAVRVWGVQQVGNRLYASDMLNGLFTLDITPLRRP